MDEVEVGDEFVRVNQALISVRDIEGVSLGRVQSHGATPVEFWTVRLAGPHAHFGWDAKFEEREEALDFMDKVSAVLNPPDESAIADAAEWLKSMVEGISRTAVCRCGAGYTLPSPPTCLFCGAEREEFTYHEGETEAGWMQDSLFS